MNNRIKVTAEYEIPETSKFDLLMAEYEAAKKYADETVAYYKPLADVAEEAKMIAILEQLETIKKYATQIRALRENKNTSIEAYVSREQRDDTSGTYFKVALSSSGQYRIIWGNIDFNLSEFQKYRYGFNASYGEAHNILGNWEKWKVYESLERDAFRQLEYLIDVQEKRAQAQVARLNNITKGGN